jgi:uridine phosphorylase
MATPEGKIKTKIKKLLKTYEDQGIYYEMPVPSGYGKSGLDFYGCFRGYFFAIEAKALKGMVTPLQDFTINNIRASGGAVFVIRDDHGLKELDVWLVMVSAMNRQLVQVL